MHLIRRQDCRDMPWKNGGGTTTEIAVHPPGAGLDAFGWRVSMARVAVDGPFSAFPGVDRVLSVLDGAGIRLAIADQPPLLMRPASMPHAFAADVACSAALVAGPITDLNVMVRRGRWRAEVTALELDEGRSFTAGAGVTLLFVVDGLALAGDLRLAARDTLVLTAGESAALAPHGPLKLLRIALFPVA